MAHVLSQGSSHSINTGLGTMPSEWTLAAWVNFANLTGPPALFRKDQNSAPYIDGSMSYSTGNSAWILEWSYSTTWAEYHYSHFGNGSDTHVCLSWDQSSAGIDPTLYYDGSSQTPTSSAASAGTRTNRSSVDLYLFSGLTFGLDFAPNADVWDLCVYDRVLSHDEVDALASGVSPLLIPAGLQLYYPADRSTLLDYAGQYGPTYSTGGVTTNRRVYWPIAFQLYQASSGTISGTSAGSSTVAGTLTGSGALSGTAAGTSTTASALQAAGAVSGTAAGSSTIGGTITATGALSGSVSTSSTVDGTLQDSTGGAITGTSAGISTATGTLTATGALSATSSTSSAVSGDLTGIAVLSGSISGSSSTSAVLAATGALFGSADGLSSLAATVTALGALTGTAAGITTVTGAMGAPITGGRILLRVLPQSIELAVPDQRIRLGVDDARVILETRL